MAMNEEDLRVLDTVNDLESPLDNLEEVDAEKTPPPPNPEEMLLLLEHPQSTQRIVAARAFCELKDQRAIPFLIKLLKDSCPLTRVSAAYALGRNPSPLAIEPLITLLREDWNGYVRKGVVWALGNSGDSSTLQPLIKTLKTDISAVRLWAASSIVQIAQLEYASVVIAMPPLIEALRGDVVAPVRSNCAWAVGQLCRELPLNVVYATAIDALIEALAEDPDLGVKEDAKLALLKVGDPRGLKMIEELEQEGWI